MATSPGLRRTSLMTPAPNRTAAPATLSTEGHMQRDDVQIIDIAMGLLAIAAGLSALIAVVIFGTMTVAG